MVAALRWVLVRECWRHTPDIATLSRRAGIPYEALRHFMTDPQEKHMLGPVNEEKLCRALGHDSGFYRDLVRRFLQRQRGRACAPPSPKKMPPRPVGLPY